MPIPGRPPSLINPPVGLLASTRAARTCARRTSSVDPQLEPVPRATGHRVACLLPHETRARAVAAAAAPASTPDAAAQAVPIPEDVVDQEEPRS